MGISSVDSGEARPPEGHQQGGVGQKALPKTQVYSVTHDNGCGVSSQKNADSCVMHSMCWSGVKILKIWPLTIEDFLKAEILKSCALPLKSRHNTDPTDIHAHTAPIILVLCTQTRVKTSVKEHKLSLWDEWSFQLTSRVKLQKERTRLANNERTATSRKTHPNEGLTEAEKRNRYQIPHHSY